MNQITTKKTYSKPVAELIDPADVKQPWTALFPETFGCDAGCDDCYHLRYEDAPECHHYTIHGGNEDRYDR